MGDDSREIPGLVVTVDRVVRFDAGDKLPPDRPHAFVYYLTVHNDSQEPVTLMARKWVVHEPTGSVVIEGDKIVGQTPRIEPGGHFSYNSFHTTAGDARAEGSFHGLDDSGSRVHVRIPSFKMTVPREGTA